MATRFEIVLPGDDETRLRAIAEEALDEVERIESLLSPFRPTSEIAHLNAHAALAPVRVSRETFQLLQHAARLNIETNGAFDITVGPLMRAWGFINGTGHLPTSDELLAARACVGMNLVQFNEDRCEVHFAKPGVQLDLGAIGKGYAVGRAAKLLRKFGVTSALIHGGTSTVYAIGGQAGAGRWKIAVADPRFAADDSATLLTTFELCDEALSVSAGHGKFFQTEGGDRFGHVLNPRIGQPVNTAKLAVVVMDDATETDAISTALLSLDMANIQAIQATRPRMRVMLEDPCRL